MNPKPKIPQYLIDLLSSSEFFETLRRVTNVVGLNLDQEGELYVLICNIFTGKDSSDDFYNNLVDKLEVSREVAQRTIEEVNHEIFQVFRARLQTTTQAQQAQSNASLEKAGNFTIEPTGEAHLDTHAMPIPVKPYAGPTHVEPLVDLLMTTPVANSADKVIKPAHSTGDIPPNLPTGSEPPARTPVVPPRPAGPDPYREPIE